MHSTTGSRSRPRPTNNAMSTKVHERSYHKVIFIQDQVLIKDFWTKYNEYRTQVVCESSHKMKRNSLLLKFHVPKSNKRVTQIVQDTLLELRAGNKVTIMGKGYGGYLANLVADRFVELCEQVMVSRNELRRLSIITVGSLYISEKANTFPPMRVMSHIYGVNGITEYGFVIMNYKNAGMQIQREIKARKDYWWALDLDNASLVWLIRPEHFTMRFNILETAMRQGMDNTEVVFAYQEAVENRLNRQNRQNTTSHSFSLKSSSRSRS